MLCALTICALFLFAANVSSKQTPPDAQPYRSPVSAFALKNPNAFDAARRRSVRAMHVPRESAADMALGIDQAEEDAPETASAQTQETSPRVAEAQR